MFRPLVCGYGRGNKVADWSLLVLFKGLFVVDWYSKELFVAVFCVSLTSAHVVTYVTGQLRNTTQLHNT